MVVEVENSHKLKICIVHLYIIESKKVSSYVASVAISFRNEDLKEIILKEVINHKIGCNSNPFCQ